MKKLYLYIFLLTLTINLFAQVSFKLVNNNNEKSFFEELQSFKALNVNQTLLSPEGFKLAQNYPNPFNP